MMTICGVCVCVCVCVYALWTNKTELILFTDVHFVIDSMYFDLCDIVETYLYAITSS